MSFVLLRHTSERRCVVWEEWEWKMSDHNSTAGRKDDEMGLPIRNLWMG